MCGHEGKLNTLYSTFDICIRKFDDEYKEIKHALACVESPSLHRILHLNLCGIGLSP